MGGRAQNGIDYTLSDTSGLVTIAAGQSSVTVLLRAIADHIKEKKETAVMTLHSGSGYKIPKRAKTTLTIVNAP